MKTARIVMIGDRVHVETPYDEDFVAELKSLPWQERGWLPDERAWWVSSRHLEHVKNLVIHHFGGVEMVDEDGVVETWSPGARTRQERLF